jgi:hypothetical protein
MAVPVFGMLCLGLFVLTMMAAGIAVLVMFIKLVSGSAPTQPAKSAVGLKTFISAAALVFVGLMLFVGLTFTSVRSVRTSQMTATRDYAPPMPPELQDYQGVISQEAEQSMQRARHEAEAAMQRGRDEAEAAMRRAMAQLPVPTAPPQAAPPALVASIEPVSAVEAIVASRPAPISEPPTSDRTVVESSSPTGPPAWITAGTKTNGETQTLVVSSKQYATEGEAKQDADRQVVALLTEDLRKHTSQTWIRPSEIIGLPEALPLAVRERYVEIVNRDFGSFFAPMYRVWYRVELSPRVRESGLIHWRGAVAESRMIMAGGGFLALLCVPLAVLAFGYGNRRTAGKARGPLAFGVSAVVLLAWLTGAKLFAKYFILWG